MNYDMPLYRPPSEAYSMIFQVTLGCSHNKCKFCYMYKTKRFRVKSIQTIEREIEFIAKKGYVFDKVFLADGDALVIKTETMLEILRLIKEKLPFVKRVSAYANPSNILTKSEDELREISKAGLKMLYIGIESGDDEILKLVDKGADSSEIIESIKKARRTGFLTSTTVVLGLGGRERSTQHAVNTAKLINESPPDYLSLLTLMLGPLEDEYREKLGVKWTPLDPIETLVEIREIIRGIDRSGIIFRTNHASNYLPLKGTIAEDKHKLIKILNDAIENPEKFPLTPEFLRGL
ncbi:MAG: radical SAM protein [Deltaproteobacteria bacterium]|nr:radical SAM protein [Deltaproteobacteria bacterium]